MKHTSPLPPLQPLLFAEVCLLLFAAGIVAARYAVPALAFCALVAWVDKRMRRPVCCLLAVLCVFAGWRMGLDAEPRLPDRLPHWLETSLAARRAVAVEGTVVRVRGLPDQRLQVILEEVRPVVLENAESAEGPDSKETAEPLPGKLALTWQDGSIRPLPGEVLSAALKIRPVHGFRNRGGGDFEDYWHRQGVFFQAWVKDTGDVTVSGKPAFGAALRERLRQQVETALAVPGGPFSDIVSRGAAVIPALLFGDRFGLDSADLERINAAGLAHSLALSGQHLAVAGLCALALTALVGLAAPGMFLRLPAYCLLGLLSLPLAAGYLWLGDAPPSLVRAALMLAATCLLRCIPGLLPENLRLRPAFTLVDMLLVALFCMLLNDPLCLYDLGAQLSFAAVAGMALALPWFRETWRRSHFSVSPLAVLQGRVSGLRARMTAALNLLWLTFGCSVAAQFATLPLVLDAFGRSTLWFPLNLLWLPVLGMLVLPLAFLGLLLASVGLEQAASFPLRLAALPCGGLLDALHWLQTHVGMDTFSFPRPHWSALLGFAALVVGLALRLNRRKPLEAGRRLLLAAAGFLAVGPLLWTHAFFSPQIALRVLDVGQGQAVLLEWPHNGRALVDGGGLSSERFDTGRDILSPLLSDNNLMQLDFIALSHPDRDHAKGLVFIASRYALDAAYTAPLEGIDEQEGGQFGKAGKAVPLAEALASTLAARGIPRHSLHAGDRIPLEQGLELGLELEVLAPPPGLTPSGNNGLVLRLTLEGRGLALLPGDAEIPYLRAMLQSGADLSAEVLVLPHHGSASNLLPELYDAVAPRLAIASAGAYNSYRLPSQRVRDELAQRGIPLHVTGEDGEIDIIWNARGPQEASDTVTQEAWDKRSCWGRGGRAKGVRSGKDCLDGKKGKADI